MMNKADESNDHQSGKYAALIQQFKNLQVEWRSLQKSISSTRSNPRSSDDDVSILTSFDQILLEKSPRSLMSNLQQRTIKPNLLLRVKNHPSCDHMAVQEIVHDRQAAGKIKGRRLFQPVKDSNGSGSDLLSQQRDVKMVDENICCRGLVGELHDEMSVDSGQPFSFSDNSLLPEKKAVVVVEEEKSGRGYVVSMAWFAFVLILVTLGLISMGCNGKFLQENQLILVPT